RPSYLMDVTNPDWTPSLHLGYDTNSSTKSEERHQRRSKRAATSKEILKANGRVLQSSNKLNVQQSTVCSTITGMPLGSPNAMDNKEADEPLTSRCTIKSGSGTPLGSPVAVHGKEADEPHASDCTVNSGSGPPLVPSPEVGRASSGSTVGAAVDASSYVKFYETAVQATTATAEASVNTTSSLKDAETQTDITGSILKCFEADNQALRTEFQQVKGSLDTLQLSDSRVQFYTGLPSYTVLIALFTLVESSVPHRANNALAKFQEFVLTLMRLRLGAALQDLVYRFEISQATATRIFDRWIKTMHACLRELVDWPSREQLQQTMPMAFRKSKERLLCTRTGSSSSKWPYYWLLHNFMGSLPMNDDLLVEENVEATWTLAAAKSNSATAKSNSAAARGEFDDPSNELGGSQWEQDRSGDQTIIGSRRDDSK
ncbi:hypothetical protein MTO96_043409, partial [Rhipicephalus appendiculatus]